MANTFGTDILIQAPDPKNAASFYVEQLGFEITDECLTWSAFTENTSTSLSSEVLR